MRVFSNFDTRLKQRALKKYQAEFGNQSVVLIVKGKLFWWLKIFPPFFIFSLLAGGIGLLLWYFVGEKIGILAFVVFGLLRVGFVFGPLLHRFIEYKMDFTIVTPELLIRYDQEGFFHRDITTLNVLNIKTVSVEKSGFRYSFANTGNLIVLSEGYMENGEVILHFVHKPEKQRHAIVEVLTKAMHHKSAF